MIGLEGVTRVKGPTIRTRVGAGFDFDDPEGSDVVLADIAHALGNLCRFTGHTRWFYSVAEHSVHASHLVPAGDAAAALLHDAVEAYVGDVSRPLKSLLPGYREIEARVERAILGRFGVPSPLPASVRRADAQMLVLEQRIAMDCSDLWPDLADVAVPDLRLEFWPPHVAAQRFLERAMELGVRVR
jgi:uncharacterized protein